MSTVVSLDKDKFSIFMEILKAVSKSCDDLTIKDGKICQKSNNRKFIYQINVESILNNEDMSISNVVAKSKIFAPFHSQQVDMEVVIEEQGYSIQDEESQFKFGKPLASHMANPHMTEEEVIQLLKVDPNGKIAEFELNKHLIDRLTASTEALSATLLRLEFNSDSLKIKIKPLNLNSTSIMNLVTVDDLDVEINGYCVFPVEPFQLTVDKFKCELWYREDHQTVLMKLETFLDGEETVPMTLWGLSDLKTD